MAQFPPKLQAARFLAIRRWGYLAAAFWALIPVERNLAEHLGFPTLGVDRWWRLYFDPAAVAHWDVPVLASVLQHEVTHLLHDHPRRRESKLAHPRVWNLAADFCVNPGLKGENAPLPSGAVYPKMYGLEEGWLAEKYYDALLEQSSKIQVLYEIDSETPTPGQPLPGVGAGRCGSCSGSNPEPWEQGEPSEQDPGVGQAEAETIRIRVAEDIQKAAKKGRGTVAGNWERWAQQKLTPQVNWREKLNGLVRRTVADVSGLADYSYARPSRRQGMGGTVIFPAMRRPLPQVAIVIDTSGSMGQTELAQAIAETGGVLRKLGLRDGCPVLTVDAQVHSCRRIFKETQVKLYGGGGTDMGRGIAAAAALRPKPHAAIVLTDGYTPWPSTPTPGMGVVAAIIGDGQTDNWQVPAWIRKVVIPLAHFREAEE